MNDIGVLLLIFLMVAMIVGFLVLLAVIIVRKPSSKPSPVKPVSLPINQQPTIVWSETKRGFYSSNDLPPCFQGTVDVSKIFMLLRALKLDTRYIQLLDVYSMLLCQANVCNPGFLDDRIRELSMYGADVNNKAAVEIVSSVTRLSNNKTATFLVMACDVIEKQIAKMKNDTDISTVDKQAIIGYNSQFYRTNLDNINKKCA